MVSASSWEVLMSWHRITVPRSMCTGTGPFPVTMRKWPQGMKSYLCSSKSTTIQSMSWFLLAVTVSISFWEGSREKLFSLKTRLTPHWCFLWYNCNNIEWRYLCNTVILLLFRVVYCGIHIQQYLTVLPRLTLTVINISRLHFLWFVLQCLYINRAIQVKCYPLVKDKVDICLSEVYEEVGTESIQEVLLAARCWPAYSPENSTTSQEISWYCCVALRKLHLNVIL